MNNIDKDILKAVQVLKSHGVVGIPTETVYGLAASIHSEQGIDAIFSTKERPFFDPLIVHVSHLDQAKECAKKWTGDCELLANEFWPGPLTLILPKSSHISDKITSGLDTVGIRMPQHDITLKLIQQLGVPVAAPSANKFKKTSPTSYQHVKDSFKDLLVLDGGICEVGIESTILGFDKNAKPVIYRPGMISKDQIEKCLKIDVKIQESPVAPGHLKHHYMPETVIIASLTDIALKEQNLDEELLKNPVIWKLPDSPVECARVLYSKFRDLDQKKSSAIIIKFTSEQLKNIEFEAIFNRLFKAATFKFI